MKDSPISKRDSMVSAPGSEVPVAKKPIGRYRWTICALLFFATTINYVDRQVLGLLAPLLQTKIGWNEIQYGHIVTAFQVAYALGLVAMGQFIDRVGTRLGYAVAIGIWSLSAMAHSLVHTALGFGIVRFALGFGESGNFPAAIKTIAEWFPKKERALATGIFNSGTNIGATVAPLAVPWVAIHLGWRFAFLFTGLFSAIWIVCWLVVYRKPSEHPKLSSEEFSYIHSDPPEATSKIAWWPLLGYRQTWALILGKFLTDPIWWFLLFWLPKFFSSEHHLSLTRLGLPLVVIYNAATIGSIGGGWLAAKFLKIGWTLNRARKTAMLVCALAVVPIVAAANVKSLWGAVALISLAAAAHQGWSANLFTLASDMFPKRAVGSVVGIGGFGGAIGGALLATFVGYQLQMTHSYVPLFAIAGSAYLIALLVIQVLSPHLRPANWEDIVSR
jgi:ACS family hexuronate transporter-like MFS transporter